MELQKVAVILPVFNEIDEIDNAPAPKKESVSRGDCYKWRLQRWDARTVDHYSWVRTLRSKTCSRAHQMNLGAQAAEADILLFLHIDLRLPDEALQMIQKVIEKNAIGGGFWKKYIPSHWLLDLYSAMLNLIYLSCGKNFVGTNGIFLSRRALAQVGEYPQVIFLEDMIFSQMMKRLGSMGVIPRHIKVSSRRYLKRGVFSQILQNAMILFRYKILHQSEVRLKKQYEPKRSALKRQVRLQLSQGSVG
jgi:hypothetical protein